MFYLHGLPGGPAELAGFRGPQMTALDRLGQPGTTWAERLNRLAASLPDHAHLVGFSLGAMSALYLASHHPGKVGRLTLLAPGAPLELGEFLPHMAGAPVFRAAIKGRWALLGLTGLQAVALNLASHRFFTALTKTAPVPDQIFFGEAYTHVLNGWATAILRHPAAYRQELMAYVTPWSDWLPRVTCPVTLHAGEADDWVPPAMVAALADALPNATLISHKGLGHYATAKAGIDAL